MRGTLLLALALAACAPAWRSGLDAWTPQDPLPNFPLVDADNRAVKLGAEPTLVAFAFSRCVVPSACPQTLERLRAVEGQVRTVVVTLDPAHDRGEELAAWSARSGLLHTTFATGDAEVVEAMSSCFNVFVTKDMAHPVKAALLVERKIVRVFHDNDFGLAQLEGTGQGAQGPGHRG